jgi:hypothetical protein
MSTLNLIITTAGQAALAQAGTLGPVVISKVAIGSGTWSVPPTSAATALNAQVKQLDPSGSETPAPGLIHITATDGTTDAYNIYEIGLYTSTGILFAIAGGTTLFLTKATGSSALFSVDLAITNVPSGSLTIGDTGFSYPPATETSLGVAEIATTLEVMAGLDDERIVTPKKMAEYYAANGSGIATGLALADTIKTLIAAAKWDTSAGDPRYTHSATWYLTTGKTLISDTFNVPLGEVWEVQYDAPLQASTDDWTAWAWLVDGALSQLSPFVSTSSFSQFNAGESVSNTFSEKLSAGTHTITFKVGGFTAGGASGPDVLGIGYVTPSYRIIRKYSGSATSNQVLTGYALNAVDKSTQTIADSTNRVATYTSTWYQAANYVVATDSITVPVGQVWDIEYDWPIDVVGSDNYATAWILNGYLDSNAALKSYIGTGSVDGVYLIPNQYKVTLQAGTHSVVFKHAIFGGSGTDAAKFGNNNKVIRKFSSAATSAGIVSKTTNGYQILPSGLIMQWGTGTSLGTYGVQTITFPIPFTTACLHVMTVGTASSNVANAHDENNWKVCVSPAPTVNNFQCFNAWNGSQGTANAPKWFAIGY